MAIPQGPNAFPQTQWTLVLAAGGSEKAGPALEMLCQRYWGPLFSFARRDGQSEEAAQDAVQGFLAQLLERGDLARVAPEKGKFRSWLLAGLKNHLAGTARRESAKKRGGGVDFVQMDATPADGGRPLEIAGGELSPEEAFDRRWAELVLARALDRVQADYARRGKGALYDALHGSLTGDETESYAAVGAGLGLTEGATAVAIHRLRQKFREMVRAEVMETVGSTEDLEEEMRYLLEVLSR